MGRGKSATCLAALVLAAVLAGCGGDRQTNTSTTAPARRSTAVHPPAADSTTAPTSSSPSAYWPYTKLVASLAGRTVGVSSTTVRLDPALLECNGEGVPIHAGPAPGWRSYTCTQTLFQDGVDHDVTFDVKILGPAQLRITSPRNGPE